MTTHSSSSSNAMYHPIPQAPVASAPLLGNGADDSVEGEQIEETEEGNRIPNHSALPIDRTIWWIHYILGCAVLLPWNVLITATPYFLSQLRTSSLRTAFSSYLSISFTLANFIFVALATVTAKQSSPSRRIFVSSIALTSLVFILTIHTFTSIPAQSFFFLILINGILQATAGAYLQCAVVAIASLFGPVAMQACMAGQAGVAVAISTVQVISAIASLNAPSSGDLPANDGSAEARAAMFFFGVSTIFLMLTILAQACLIRMPAYRVAVAPSDNDKPAANESSTSPLTAGALHLRGNVWRVLRLNATFEFAASYVFLITLAVFPPITSSILPTNPSFNPLLFNSIHFLLFSIGDLLGRHLCSMPRFACWNPRRLCTYSLLRTVFIPLFLLCNIQKPNTSPMYDPSLTPSAPLINSDILYFLILLAFGTSNGFISSMSMMAAPSLEHNPLLRNKRSDVDLAATIMSFCMVGGLVVGSAMSFVVRGAVCGCNPFKE